MHKCIHMQTNIHTPFLHITPGKLCGIQFSREPIVLAFKTHEILNKSIMCRQMNNKQQNCLILSITHNTMKLKSWRLRTQAHTHKHLTQLTHFEPSTKWYTYIISHSQMCFYAAHILSVNVSIICQFDCCWFHNNTVLSAITPRHSSVFGWCGASLFSFTCPVLNFACQCVSVFSLQHLCPFLSWCFLSLCTLKNVSFSDTTSRAMLLNSDVHMLSCHNGWN